MIKISKKKKKKEKFQWYSGSKFKKMEQGKRR